VEGRLAALGNSRGVAFEGPLPLHWSSADSNLPCEKGQNWGKLEGGVPIVLTFAQAVWKAAAGLWKTGMATLRRKIEEEVGTNRGTPR